MECYVKDYPRPQFVRDNWTNLNGIWDFRFDDENIGEASGWMKGFEGNYKIEVPFTYETKKSGIGIEEPYVYVWYQRTVTVNKSDLKGKRLMIHFEGSDFLTKVWINGQLAGQHEGGYTRFSFDLTDLVKEGENILVVKAEDQPDIRQPRGKQRWIPESFDCWYVQTTGIWKTVWMEAVPEVRLKSAKITPLLQTNSIEILYEYEADCPVHEEEIGVEAEITFAGQFITKDYTVLNGRERKVIISLVSGGSRSLVWGIRTWSPEEPNLYDLNLKLNYKGKTEDEVKSYFGMREIRIDGPNVLLNGKPLYQRLILDQGYWKDSHLTPPSEEALIEDIDKIHELGYNGLRKHQKIEDERFLYWCDVKGMLVWSEVAATYAYSDYAVSLFTKEWLDIVRLNYNHPSIITWTPFNESWGIRMVETDRTQQHFTEAIYHLTKSLDPYRPVVVNDGWEHTISDILTLHDYEESGVDFYERYSGHKDEIMSTELYHSSCKSAMANGFEYKGQPVVITEFGGIAFSKGDGWGYGNKVRDEEEFLKRFDDITTAIKKVPYISGYCYTQVTDVQQEMNGLMDMDRNFKVDAGKVREINERNVGAFKKDIRNMWIVNYQNPD